MKEREKATLTDFYKKYPYKKRDTTLKSTDGIYHIPKTEYVDDHKFSITRKEYLSIAKEFFSILLFEYLIWGSVFKMPHKFGNLCFKKCKQTKTKNVDFGTTNKLYKQWNLDNPDNKKVIYHKNYHSQGYGVYLLWDKRDAYFTNKYIMRFDIATRLKWKLGQLLKNNPKIINYINEWSDAK